MADAEGGAILRSVDAKRTEILAVHPHPDQEAAPPPWLAQALRDAPKVFRSGQTGVEPLHEQTDLYGHPARRHVGAVPLRSEAGPTGAAAFVVQAADPAALTEKRQRLELTVALLSLYEMRLTLQRRQIDFRRLRSALEILAAVNEHDRFTAGAMSLCNEIASRHQCDRVGVGFLKGRYVALKAMSHTEKFSRKMKLVQDVEAAMEECLDQDMEVLHPPPPQTTFVNRAARELSTRHGPTAVASLPMRREGEVVAVVTLERPIDRPFGPQEIETLRLTCELCTPRLVNLEKHDHWVGARAAGGVRKLAGAVLGPKHTWLKLLVLAVIGAAVFLTFARGPYRAEAPFVFQAIEQRVVPAPFDGYISEVKEDVLGKHVKKGEMLAELDTSDLALELGEALAEKRRYETEAKAASDVGETAKVQIAQAQADQVGARIRRLQERLKQATITTPIAGRVVKIREGAGDLASQIGAPVKTGDVLFEVARPGSLRAELSVPEDLIADVTEGMKGELVAATHPDRKVGLVVERINPVAEVVNQRNVFKVRVRLAETAEWMRPGMEGLAKIHIDERAYGWIWTRRLVNWVRMKLWW